MNRPRAADDFATIRARLEELLRKREAVYSTDGELQSGPSVGSARSQREISAGPGRVRQSAPVRS
jgi:hypothetical protein